MNVIPTFTDVGFFAYTSGTFITTASQIIPFETVARNDGQGYNSTTSTFTAPVAGVYYFYWNILVYSSSGFGARLMQNGSEKIRHFYKTSGWDSSNSGGSIYLRLKKGEKVYLKADKSGGKIAPNFYSYFGGELIRY